MQLHRLFGSISKVAEEDDGSLKVYGIASSGSRDGAGEIITPEAMKAALPDYSRFPALREMHQPSAAGKVFEVDVDEDGITRVAAHVVDPLAITKVRAGVYGGFSIGGRVTKRDPNDPSIITGLKLVEISLVDSPCNPDAVLSMWKADIMTEFKPSSNDVIAKAKLLAESAGTKRFRDFLFEAAEELTAEHLLKVAALEEADADAAVKAALDEELTKKEGKAPKEEDGEDGSDTDDDGDQNDEGDSTSDGDDTNDEGDDNGNNDKGADDDDNSDDSDDKKKKSAEIDPAAILADALKSAEAVIEKATAAPEPDPAPEPEPGLFDDMVKVGGALVTIADAYKIEKGMAGVSILAQLLDQFAQVTACINNEEAMEADGDSKQPDKARSVLAAMGQLLVTMVQEEVAEAVAGVADDPEPILPMVADADDYVTLANQLIDAVKADEELMAKVGARHNKGDMTEIQGTHDSMVKLGALCDSGNCAAAEKFAAAEIEKDRLAKALSEAAPAVEEVTKRFSETIDGLKANIADLEKRFSELDQTPLPAKTAGSAAVLVTKGADASGFNQAPANESVLSKEAFQEELAKLPEHDRVHLLTKIALTQPHLIQVR